MCDCNCNNETIQIQNSKEKNGKSAAFQHLFNFTLLFNLSSGALISRVLLLQPV